MKGGRGKSRKGGRVGGRGGRGGREGREGKGREREIEGGEREGKVGEGKVWLYTRVSVYLINIHRIVALFPIQLLRALVFVS